MLTRFIQAGAEGGRLPGGGASRYVPRMAEQRDLDNGNGNDVAPDTQATQKRQRRGPPPNPLYHPLFLPVLLIAFTLWFGYDGFLTSDPDMLKHQAFNRVMFAIMLPLCIWMVPKGIKEFREDQAKAADAHSSGKSH